MNRLSETPLSRLRQFVFCSALFLGCLNQASAALPCGAPPDLEPEILQPPPKTNLRTMITATRRELRQTFTDADKQSIDRYLLWATCRDISDNPELAPTQKFDKYADYYRMIGEPIALTVPNATLALNQPRPNIQYFPKMNEFIQPRRS